MCLLYVGSARAQFGVYGMVTGQRFGGINCPSFASPCAAGGGRAKDYGGTFGVQYDLRTFGPVRLGVDARGETFTSNKRADSSAGGVGIMRQYSVLGGIRGSVATPISWLRPYAEIAAGYTRNNANGVYTETTTVNNTVAPPLSVTTVSFNPAVYTSQPMFKAMVGADVHVGPHFDIRAIELGIGDAFGSSNTVLSNTSTVSASGTSTASSVIATSPSSHSLTSISAGLVLHF